MRPDRPRAAARPPIVTIAAGIGLPVRASTTAPWIAAGDVTNERAAAAALVGVPGAGVEAAEAIDAPAVGTSAVACAANAAPDGAKQTMASAHALALDHWANGFVIDLSPWAGRRTHSRASRRQPSNARPPRGRRAANGRARSGTVRCMRSGDRPGGRHGCDRGDRAAVRAGRATMRARPACTCLRIGAWVERGARVACADGRRSRSSRLLRVYGHVNRCPNRTPNRCPNRDAHRRARRASMRARPGCTCLRAGA